MNFKIKERRKNRGLSQMRLAAISQVSRYRIGLHEQGYQSLGPDELSRIDAALRSFDLERRDRVAIKT